MLDPRWTVKLGHAWTDGGWVYIQNNGDPHRDGFILTGEGADWGDYRIVTRFFTETWPYRGTVCFRVQECSGWCFWSGTATMYGLMLSTLDGALRLDKRFGQQIEDSIVGLVVLYPPDGVIHDQDNILEIEVVGGNIKVAINGVDVLDYTDPDPILTGGVGLASTWEGTTRFDYITIEDVRPNLPPTCQAKLINPGYGELKVRDDGGLAEINIVNDRNAELVIPPFTPGTTDPVLVTASKIVPDDSWSVAIEAVDVHGNSITCDPMITLQIREKGKPVSVTITEADGILPEDIYVSVQNGDPGIKNLEIIVNGEKFKVTGLGDNEETTIDILSAMLDADNSITLTAKGKPNTSATVVIHDGSMQF